MTSEPSASHRADALHEEIAEAGREMSAHDEDTARGLSRLIQVRAGDLMEALEAFVAAHDICEGSCSIPACNTAERLRAALEAPSAQQEPGEDPSGHPVALRLEKAAEALRERRVAGHCPSCGWESLILGDGGHIVCCRLECPRPTAADEILADDETEHIVKLSADTFTVRHPLRERLNDQLMTCDLHDWIAACDGPPRPPGRWRVTPASDGSWTWEATHA